MRRLKRYILTSIAAVGALILSGCAAETPDVPITAPDDSPFYLTFQLATPGSGSSGPAHAPATRVEDSSEGTVDKNEEELTVTSIIAYMVDVEEGVNKNRIAGVAYGDKVIIGDLTDPNGTRTRTITLNMGVNTLYKREHNYWIYVLANISVTDDLVKDVIGKKIGSINSSILSLSGGLTILPGSETGKLATVGLPMSTTDTDAAKIKVWLEEKKEDGTTDYSTSSTAYVVKSVTDETQAGVLDLTPLYSRFDFAFFDEKTNFNYPIQYKVGEGTNAPTETEMYVEFKQARVAGAAEQVYTVLQTGSGNQKYVSPSQNLTGSISSSQFKIENSKVTTSGLDSYTKPAIYVPEYIPTVGTDKMLNYKQVTYLELDAVLKADADCKISGTVKDAINKTGDYASTPAASMPALGYYDDGQYQSTLMLWDDSKMKVANHWTKLVWESKTVGGETVSGYWVTYRHAIRHGAVGTGSSNADDGVVYPMEYGVVRNHLYQIGIESVSALPHPWETTTLIESPNKDINIKILPPKQWTYHRGGFNLTFE